jgi:hypothetical protein
MNVLLGAGGKWALAPAECPAVPPPDCSHKVLEGGGIPQVLSNRKAAVHIRPPVHYLPVGLIAWGGAGTLQERSSLYEKLVELEEAAKKGRKGLHNPKEAPPNRINDVSQPGSGAK